ncbi:MAG: single-stranded DNA-binding protein [Deltaproteobacteria bacterium]|nr:single-stranded DNA-binding protein [Deltaproteobacteria bacterium]MBI2341270.1 single-stranded DNA-binding protein [Deltaproteobacteria bacterium]MBI2974159.1 single-stranded DNA-binding protein [Deltaproteobacteria bacterium]
MASLNKVMIIGNLGADPEVRSTGSGQSVATLRVATTERWMDKSGQKTERTEWHRVIVWGKQAELCKEYLSKGRQVYAEGRLQTREWTDKEGNKRYTTEVVAQRIQFLGSGSGKSTRHETGDSASSSFSDTSMPGFPVDEASSTGDSDIPF